MTDASWLAFLDTLESELQAVARVPNAQPIRATFRPPPDLGPIPHDMAERAQRLLGVMEAAADQLRADMAHTTRQLRELRQLDPRGPSPASTFDHRA